MGPNEMQEIQLVHERAFRVRRYECDAYGHVNNTNYLRYMQESAMDAWAAGAAPHAAADAPWAWREVDMEYLRPLRQGETAVVRTWVTGAGPNGLDQAHELRVNDELAARARTRSAAFHKVTGLPAPMGQDVLAAFPPMEPSARPPSLNWAPQVPPPPPGAFRMPRKVLWQDIDATQCVNSAVYLEYATDCGMEVSTAHGWPASRMTERGLAIISRRHYILYGEPARMDDEMEVATWAYDAKRATCMRTYKITRLRDHALLAQVTTLYVWVDFSTGQPVRIPRQFLADFAPNIVGLRLRDAR
jgi:acyl-CoA thioester hydrolase